MKRRLRVCTQCASHVPVSTPQNAPCPFCGFVAEEAGAAEGMPFGDAVREKGKSGVLIAALGLSMACGDGGGVFENPSVTADYGGGPINIETGPNLEPNIDPGEDAGASDAGEDAGPADAGDDGGTDAADDAGSDAADAAEVDMA